MIRNVPMQQQILPQEEKKTIFQGGGGIGMPIYSAVQ
jgi:hypothetical protein